MPPEQNENLAEDSMGTQPNPHWGADSIDDDFKELDELMAQMKAEEESEEPEEETEETEEETEEESEETEETEEETEEESEETEEESEETEEESEETEEESEETEEEETAPQNNNIKVPKSRMDREVAKRRLAEKKLEELQTKLKEQNREQELGIDDDAFAKVTDALVDGEAGVARDLLKNLLTQVATTAEQRAYERATSEIDARAVNAVTKLEAEADLDTVIDTLEDTYSILNPKHADFDADLTQDILGLQSAGIQRGLSPGRALQEAAEKMIRLNHPELLAPADEAPQDTEEAVDLRAQKVAADRAKEKKRNVAKKVKMASEHPKALNAGTGNRDADELAIDIDNLTMEEFDALPEATIRKLRGDVIA